MAVDSFAWRAPAVKEFYPDSYPHVLREFNDIVDGNLAMEPM